MRFVPTRALVFLVTSFAVLTLAPIHGRQAASKQKPAQPTFRVQVEYVEVDAVVRDKAGQFIADLKKDEFEVLEGGKRQDISNLQLIDVPVETQPAPAVLAGRRFEPDVVSNAQTPGRVYLIVLDDLHINPARSVGARKLARQFIETNVAPNDLAAVITTSGNRKSSQEFTGNRRLLFEAVDKCVGRKIMSPGLADDNAVLGMATGKADEQQRIFNARTTLDALAYLAAYAGTIHSRRKSIVLVGEGVDYDLGKQDITSGPTTTPADGQAVRPVGDLADNGVPRRELRDRLNDFVVAANRGDVTLYALDPSVFTQGGDDFIDIASAMPGDFDQYGQEIVKSARLQDDVMAAQDNLRTMAAQTGGFAVTGSLKAAQNAFERIRNENSHYYILGYYPSNDKLDGKFRKIEVRVKRAGTQVQARKGYQAPKAGKAAEAAVVETKEGTSPELRDALASVLPAAELPISVVATPFRGAAGNGSVLVMLQTPPGAVQFVEKSDRVEGNLELSFVAIDDTGKTRGGEHLEVAMPLKRDMQAIVNRTGLLIQSRVSLPPGRYVLRVGARDTSNDRVGSVHCDVEVPDYAKTPVSMSGLVVSSEQTMLANPRPDKVLTTMLPGSPSVMRNFGQTDQMGVLAEIYDTKLAIPHDIDIVTTIVGEDGQERYRHEDKRSTGELQGADGGFGYLLKVPLASVPPGSYMLRVEARSRLDIDHPAARETMLRVVGKS
jgi:VWFA-related protein